MTCHEFADYLMAYLDGELPRFENEKFEEHLAECRDCVAYLGTYKSTVELGRSCSTEQNRTDAPEDLIQAVLRMRSDREGTSI